MKTIQINITGMSCGNCVKHVTQALSKVPGVQNVKVDLASAHASLDAPDDLNPQLLIDVLDEEGYPAITN